MLTYIIKVSLCWLGFYLIYSAFLSKETFFKTNRWYLLATLLLGAVIPLIELLPIFQEDHAAIIYAMPLNESVLYVQSTVSEVVTTSSFDWMALFWAVYLTGLGICTMRFLGGLWKIYRLYAKSAVSNYRNYKLVRTKEVHLPFTFFNFLFWSDSLELNDEDGQKIITHEEAHVNGWHSVDVMLLEIINIIFWISPMVYFYKKSIRTVHEYLADAVVLQTTPTKKYGHLLLKQSQSGLQVALANHFIHSQLKQRIVMMTRNKSSRQAMVKYLFALPVVLLLFVLFSKQEIQAQTTSEKSVSTIEEITVVGFGTPNATSDFDKEKVKRELTAIALRYDRNGSKANNEKVRTEFNKLMRATYKKHYEQRTEVFAIVDELIKEYNIGWAVESSHTNGVSVIDWPSEEYLQQLEKEKITSKASTEKDDEASKKLRELLANGKNTHASLESLIPEKIKNPLVIVDGEKVTSKDPMYFTGGKIKTIEIKSSRDYIINQGGTADNDAAVIINLDEKFKPTKKANQKEYRVMTIHGENGDKKHVMIDNNKLTKSQNTNDVYKVVDEMPRFFSEQCEAMTDESERKKCSEISMLKFIYSNIKYPAAARDAGIEGKIIAQFIIEKDGSVSEAKIIRDIGGGTGEESLRVIESSPKWVPGKDKGELVRVQYTLPIRFKLEGGSSKKEKKISLSEGKIKEYIIDGKAATEAEMNALNPKDIATINVKKVTKSKDGKEQFVHLIVVHTKNYKPANNTNGNVEYYINGKRTTKEKFLSIPKNDIAEIKKDGMEVSKNGKVKEMITTIDAITKPKSNFTLEEVPVGDGSAETKTVWKKQSAQDAGFTYIKVSPNPTNGKIDIEFGSRNEQLSIIGTDVNGKEIFNYDLPGGRSSVKDVDISNAAKGIVLVTFRQGKNVYTEKIILQ